jgi:hypothetical protein
LVSQAPERLLQPGTPLRSFSDAARDLALFHDSALLRAAKASVTQAIPRSVLRANLFMIGLQASKKVRP